MLLFLTKKNLTKDNLLRHLPFFFWIVSTLQGTAEEVDPKELDNILVTYSDRLKFLQTAARETVWPTLSRRKSSDAPGSSSFWVCFPRVVFILNMQNYLVLFLLCWVLVPSFWQCFHMYLCNKLPRCALLCHQEWFSYIFFLWIDKNIKSKNRLMALNDSLSVNLTVTTHNCTLSDLMFVKWQKKLFLIWSVWFSLLTTYIVFLTSL